MQVTMEGGFADKLREHAGHVLLPGHLLNLNVTRFHAILNPEIRRGQVSDLSEATAARDADCCCSIGSDTG